MKLREYQEELWHLKNDSMDMFEKRLLNGDITCIEPYFDGHAILQRSYHHAFYPFQKQKSSMMSIKQKH